MRLIATLLMFAALVFTTAHAETSGAYASSAAANSSDCIKLCQDDTLCVGWTYSESACGLWASVPQQSSGAFTLSGRAPSFAQALPVVVAAAPSPVPPPQPRQEHAAIALLGGNDRQEALRPRFGAGN
ncbi:MAG: hypothetical protein HY054_09695 [Proteobacteria bacterium]|nr:hypothetical protein [Pseudomonadota bacterium]